VLRFDPSRAPERRTVEVWHDGKRVELARRLDALANCYVKRHNSTRVLEIDAKADAVPEGLPMRDLADKQNADDVDDDELTRLF
jgi:hypothetical protein